MGPASFLPNININYDNPIYYNLTLNTLASLIINMVKRGAPPPPVLRKEVIAMLHLDALEQPLRLKSYCRCPSCLARFLMRPAYPKSSGCPMYGVYPRAGIAVGPYVLGLVLGSVIDGMDFMTDIALAFPGAFGVGGTSSWRS